MDDLIVFIYSFVLSFLCLGFFAFFLKKNFRSTSGLKNRRFKKLGIRSFAELSWGLITIGCIVFFLKDLSENFNFWIYILALSFAFFSGLIVDYYKANARYLYAFQVISAVILILAGVKINQVSVAGLFSLDFSFFSALVTVLWIMIFMNSIALADSINGLGSGICLCASIFIIILSNSTGNSFILLFTCVISGAVASIYIFSRSSLTFVAGRGVANLTGMIFGTIPFLGIEKNIFAMLFLVPIIALVFPFVSCIVAYIKRDRSKPVFISFEKKMLHSRLMRIGLSESGTLYLLYLITGVLGMMSLLMYEIKIEYTWFIFVTMSLFLFLFFYVLKAGEDIRLERIELNNAGMNKYSRRKFLRLKTEDSITIIDEFGCSHDAKAFDYTPFGLGFYSDRKYLPGNMYNVLYHMKGRAEPVSMKLKIVRCVKRNDITEENIVGAMILEIAEQDIKAFVEENYFDILLPSENLQPVNHSLDTGKELAG